MGSKMIRMMATMIAHMEDFACALSLGVISVTSICKSSLVVVGSSGMDSLLFKCGNKGLKLSGMSGSRSSWCCFSSMVKNISTLVVSLALAAVTDKVSGSPGFKIPLIGVANLMTAALFDCLIMIK